MNNINTLIQDMISAAGTLKSCKLKVDDASVPVIDAIMRKAHLETQDEVMVLVAIFDRQCSDALTNIDDLSYYFQCSSIEAIALVSTLKSLLSKGYLKSESIRERRGRKEAYRLRAEVFRAIVDGKDVSPEPENAESQLDQFRFCSKIHDMIQSRKEENINTNELFNKARLMEEEYSSIEMVKVLKEQLDDIAARVWFYEMCYDFSQSFNGGSTDLKNALENIYDSIAEGAIVLNDFKNDNHSLIKAELAFLHYNNEIFGRGSKEELRLTEKGIRMLFGDAASAFLKENQCTDRYEFINRLEEIVNEMPDNSRIRDFMHLHKELEKIENSNAELSFIANVKKIIQKANERMLYYCVCREMLKSSSFRLRDLSVIYDKSKEMDVKRQLLENRHTLQKQGLAEIKGGNFFDGSHLVITDKGKELFLEEDKELFEEKVNTEDLIDCTKIAEKRLFFSPSIEEQLAMLRDSLQENNHSSLCKKLKAKNLPTGITVLLYGLPGTGKTESVMQIARATGRSIMHVDISQTKSCWFGESEKIIKGVFTKYRKLCSKSKVKPILLFNEADAVFSKRKDSARNGVAQTENAIQNIILEEMENLNGILIATTNLADNLDKAFERRFLFKVHFDKPTTESKVHIWKDKLTRLSDEEALCLASSFDFSGGEIDNIVRKITMEEVINDNPLSFERVMTLCGEEKIKTGRKRVGF